MTNIGNRVLYTGVTNNLRRRVSEHKAGSGSRFTSRYNITKLVYYERFDRIAEAIAAEKRLKAGSRSNKIRLIQSVKATWEDLYNRSGVEIASLRSQ